MYSRERFCRNNIYNFQDDEEEDPTSAPVPGMTVTVIACGNAVGQSISPYFVFPGQAMDPKLLKDGIPKTVATVSESGCSNSSIFEDWLKTHFLRHVIRGDDGSPLLLIYDGHVSHVSLPLIEWARQENVILHVLPSHSSQLVQPPDSGCFNNFTQLYECACNTFMDKNNVLSIAKEDICGIVCQIYLSLLSADNLKLVFVKAGIHPLKKEATNKYNMTPAAFKYEIAEGRNDDEVMKKETVKEELYFPIYAIVNQECDPGLSQPNFTPANEYIGGNDCASSEDKLI